MGKGHPWCIAWLPRDRGLPAELSDAFARRSIRIESAESDFQVLALAGSRLRAGDRGPAILVLVEPESLPGAAEVIAACERRIRGLGVWEFRPGANPALRAHVPVVKESKPAPKASIAGAPKLRLVDEGASPVTGTPDAMDGAKAGDEPADKVQRRSENADAILTHEELMMLLGEPPGEERHA